MDSHEMKIRKGQAFNLAVHDAVAASKGNDPKYIYQQFLYYYEMAGLVQKCELDVIADVLDNPDFMAAIADLQKSMGE